MKRSYLFLLPFVFCLFAATALGQTEQSLVSQSATDAAEAAMQHRISIIDLVLAAGPIVKVVLFILALMSVTTWGIILTKFFHFRRTKKQESLFEDVRSQSRNLKQLFEGIRGLEACPDAQVLQAGYDELNRMVTVSETGAALEESEDLDNIERALKRAKAEEITDLEMGTTFLATTASAAPFIGLFGTVWGIMDAFLGLSHVKSSSIQAVAPGISEALIATAIGLAAAIPAAIGYNYFMQQVRVFARSMDMVSADFLNIARRRFVRK